LGSPANRAGVEMGWRVVAVKEPADRPSPYLFYIPALLLLGIVVVLQLGRRRQAAAVTA